MKSARAWLFEIAEELEDKAVKAHVQGMSLARRAANLEQLTKLTTCAEAAAKMLATFVEEGCVAWDEVRNRYEILDSAPRTSEDN